jgi:hypothetical protein
MLSWAGFLSIKIVEMAYASADFRIKRASAVAKGLWRTRVRVLKRSKTCENLQKFAKNVPKYAKFVPKHTKIFELFLPICAND